MCEAQYIPRAGVGIPGQNTKNCMGNTGGYIGKTNCGRYTADLRYDCV